MPTATALHPLWDRAAEWQRRLAMIHASTRFLYLSTYYIEYDRYGAELIAALLAAQDEALRSTCSSMASVRDSAAR